MNSRHFSRRVIVTGGRQGRGDPLMTRRATAFSAAFTGPALHRVICAVRQFLQQED